MPVYLVVLLPTHLNALCVSRCVYGNLWAGAEFGWMASGVSDVSLLMPILLMGLEDGLCLFHCVQLCCYSAVGFDVCGWGVRSVDQLMSVCLSLYLGSGMC